MGELSSRSVSEVMTRDLVTIGRNETLLVADRLMSERGIRHLLVLDDDRRLAGVLTRRDVFRGALARALGYGTFAQEKMLGATLVKEAMSAEPFTTTPAATLSDVARTLIERRIGCLPVLDGERLVGIITEGDFVRLAL